MKQLQGKEREECIADMKKIAMDTLGCSKEQADKRVDALLTAMDNGLFDGIPDSGPSNMMEAMFVQVKTEQILNTPV
jgi:hypothetical protein